MGPMSAAEMVVDFVTGSGPPATLLIEGEAGIGKTTLWRGGTVLAERHGQRVLRAAPTQAEANLSFAALADPLAPVADALLPVLDAPVRDALEVALLRRPPTGAAPDRRAV